MRLFEKKGRNIMPKECYLCSQIFDEEETRQHEEHIIQNAIGGALISNDILCEDCGNKLGKTVDTKFAVELSPLTVLLKPPRDRGNYSKAEMTLITKNQDASHLEQVKFTLNSDFSVVPRKPVFVRSDSQRTVTVVAATEKLAKKYAKSGQVKAELKDGYTLELSTNAAEYAQSRLLPVNPNSIGVLRGVLKIAIGYASYNRVPREILKHLFEQDDLTNSEALLQSSVFPYYPTTDAERLFEIEKHTHEDWYPTHQLYLFCQGKNLYCYVELFGTIQKYVHLSSEYDGLLQVQKFVQKAEKWDFDAGIFTAKDWKDLHILAGEFGVEMGNGRSWEVIQKDVLQRASSRQYSLEPNKTIEKVKVLVDTLIEYSLLRNGEEFEVVRYMFHKAHTAKNQLGLSLLDDIKKNPMIAFQYIQQSFEDFRIGNIETSCPEQARRTPISELKKYAMYKLYDLLCAKGKENEIQYNISKHL